MVQSFELDAGKQHGERIVATGSNGVEEIYDRMAVIRRERHTNVSDSIAGAEAVMDWGRYTWTYPWIGLGAAAAAGYLVYTGSRPIPTTEPAFLPDATTAVEPVAGAASGGQERSRIGSNLLLATWDLLTPVAVRAGQNYMLHWLAGLHQMPAAGPTGLHASPQPAEWPDRPGKPRGLPVAAAGSSETKFLEDRTVNNDAQDVRAEFTPQLEDIKAMGRQDMAFARERLADGREMVRDFLVKEPVKTLGITLCVGVALGWLLRRP